MKKRYLVLTALLALSLAACSQEKAKNEEGTSKTEQSTKVKEVLVVSLSLVARKKRKLSIKEVIIVFKGSMMKSL